MASLAARAGYILRLCTFYVAQLRRNCGPVRESEDILSLIRCSESPTNTLMVRVASIRQESGEDRFSINLAFDVSGQGFRNYDIDHSEILRRHSHRMATGEALEKQLDYIRNEGPGKRRLEVEGRIEGGVKTVTTIRLYFNGCTGIITGSCAHDEAALIDRARVPVITFVTCRMLGDARSHLFVDDAELQPAV